MVQLAVLWQKDFSQAGYSSDFENVLWVNLWREDSADQQAEAGAVDPTAAF
jgi:hypothetical protein